VVLIYFNDGSGTKYQPVPFGDGKGAIYGMAAVNLDGDGWPDVVVARSDSPCQGAATGCIAGLKMPTSSQPSFVMLFAKRSARSYVLRVFKHLGRLPRMPAVHSVFLAFGHHAQFSLLWSF
jgi:hypothetical protein